MTVKFEFSTDDRRRAGAIMGACSGGQKGRLLRPDPARGGEKPPGDAPEKAPQNRTDEARS